MFTFIKSLSKVSITNKDSYLPWYLLSTIPFTTDELPVPSKTGNLTTSYIIMGTAMFCVTYAIVNIQNVLVARMYTWRRLRHWSMASSVTLCFHPTHTSVRCCLKSFTSRTFSGRFDAPHFVINWTEVRAVRRPESWKFIQVTYCLTLLHLWTGGSE